MQVYKFGGASVKDAAAVRNILKVLETNPIPEGVIVVSAMGKTTNALEEVLTLHAEGKEISAALDGIYSYHKAIAEDVLASSDEILEEIKLNLDWIGFFLNQNRDKPADYLYDQVVSVGELLSTKIISAFLNQNGIQNRWLDATEFIRTNAQYQEGLVDWETTTAAIARLGRAQLYVTQGFIGSTADGSKTTLGREGSDYSAAIFSHALNAEKMVIWKDVAGVMTADPRYFPEAELLSEISYLEAIEMAYFGASVIHPKTLQPLKQKNIPFYVRSFLNPDAPGTAITAKPAGSGKPTLILKKKQTVLTLATHDYSFITENHLAEIFRQLDDFRMKVSMMQNSAVSLKLCLEDKFNHISNLTQQLSPKFQCEVKPEISLLTVRNIRENEISRYTKDKQPLMEQFSGGVLQLAFHPNTPNL